MSATTFHRAARRGWPLIVAALLTLVLGWTALHEDRSAVAMDGGQIQQMPTPVPDGVPLEQALLRADPQPEAGRGGKHSPLPAQCALNEASPHAYAAVPLPATLSFPLPPLRQPPGQAPPAHA